MDNTSLPLHVRKDARVKWTPISFATFASTETAEVRTGTAVGLLWTQLNRVFHKVWAIYWLTMQLLASQEGLIKQTWTHGNTVARRLDWGQWRTEGGLGVQTHPPPHEIPKALQKNVPNSTRLWKLLQKIAEFRTPTHQDVPKKGSRILKLPRFAIVLH